MQFLTSLVVRVEPFALLKVTRKTERGAMQFLPSICKCAPHPLRYETHLSSRITPILAALRCAETSLASLNFPPVLAV